MSAGGIEWQQAPFPNCPCGLSPQASCAAAGSAAPADVLRRCLRWLSDRLPGEPVIELPAKPPRLPCYLDSGRTYQVCDALTPTVSPLALGAAPHLHGNHVRLPRQREFRASQIQWRLALQVQAITDYVAYPSVVGAETNVTDGSWTIAMQQQPLLFSMDIADVHVDTYNGSVQVMLLASLHWPCRGIFVPS